MKRLVMLSAGVMMGCTVTIKPLSTTQTSRHTTGHHASSKSSTVSTKHSSSSHVKETWWIENYHKLESSKGDYTIKADDEIRPLPDGRFLVPDAVLTHYQDLLLAKPSPTPTY